MASTFGWLDNDDGQRRRMLEVVDLFREQGTIDELGIGAIRDTLSNAMFPGTSTLHTRLRYALFLPWLLQKASRKHHAEDMRAAFRASEYKLINSLLSGGESEGVMGNVAGTSLKRLPSAAYWSCLGTWGLVNANSPDAYFRRHMDFRNLRDRTADADDEETQTVLPTDGIDSQLPKAPGELLSEATFSLSAQEESYLSDRIAAHTDGSLLAWLVRNEPSNVRGSEPAASFAWEIANREELPDELASLVENARRFSSVVEGAALVYNVTLARKGKRDDFLPAHEASLTEWQAGSGPSDARTWDRDTWWAQIRHYNPQLRPTTRDFVDRWITIAGSGVNLLYDTGAAGLVEMRERQIKGSRARFVNQSALDKWTGSSGLAKLDFRWGVSRSHVNDLYAARQDA